MIQIPPESAPLAVDLLKKLEGCRLKAYPDPASGGKPWTIGYGATGEDSNGNEIGPSTVWTQSRADAELRSAANKLCGRIVNRLERPVKPCQLAAMVCLAYNIGFASWENSTVRRLFNAGDEQGAGNAFRMWNKAAGQVNVGLTNRRETERAVFLRLATP